MPDASANPELPPGAARRAPAEGEGRGEPTQPGSSDVMTRDRAERVYRDLLASIGARARQINRPLASHWPHVGRVYDGLVIAGQALHGWDEAVVGARWRPEQAATSSGRESILRQTQTWFAEAPDAVGVVATLPSRRNTPYWQMSRDIVEALAPGAGPTFARQAWANLYPVSFDGREGHRAGSPTGALRDAQMPFAIDLFRAEMQMLEARRVVLMTGPFWRSVTHGQGLEGIRARPFPLIAAGLVDGVPWVVGYHPGYTRRGWPGPNRRPIPDGEFVQAIADTVRQLEATRGRA